MEINVIYVSENEELNYTFWMVLLKCHLDPISQRYSIKHQIRLDIMLGIHWLCKEKKTFIFPYPRPAPHPPDTEENMKFGLVFTEL